MLYITGVVLEHLKRLLLGLRFFSIFPAAAGAEQRRYCVCVCARALAQGRKTILVTKSR